MTDPGGLGEAILLRLVDRIISVEQQTASNATALRAITESVGELRSSVSQLSHDVGDARNASNAALQTFEQMRKPLQQLMDLRQKFSGVWLVATALLMVAAYLFQPLLAELYRWHFAG